MKAVKGESKKDVNKAMQRFLLGKEPVLRKMHNFGGGMSMEIAVNPE